MHGSSCACRCLLQGMMITTLLHMRELHSTMQSVGRCLQLIACVQASALRTNLATCGTWRTSTTATHARVPLAPTADAKLQPPSSFNFPAADTQDLRAKTHTCRRREKRSSARRATAPTLPSSAHAHGGLLQSPLQHVPTLLLLPPALLPLAAVHATVAMPLKCSMWCSQVEVKGKCSTRMVVVVGSV